MKTKQDKLKKCITIAITELYQINSLIPHLTSPFFFPLFSSFSLLLSYAQGRPGGRKKIKVLSFTTMKKMPRTALRSWL
jgi:hypothetical protein